MLLKHIFETLSDILFPRKKSATINREHFFHDLAHIPRAHTDTVLENASCSSLFPYQHQLIRASIHALKYERQTWIANVYALLLAEMLTEEIADKNLFGTYTNPLLIPIPIHRIKKVQRGFNQTELLAERLLKHISFSLTLETSVLCAVNQHESQARQHSREHRRQHTSGKFFIEHPEKVVGRDIILLDDVITTGSTMQEAERVLLEAGVRNVFGVTVAH